MKLRLKFSKKGRGFTRAGTFVTSHFFLESIKANMLSRPVSPLLEHIPGWGDGLIFLPYGIAIPLSSC